MLYIVAYDVRDAARLRKVAKICKDYGARVEYSVFECRLSTEGLEKLVRELDIAIKPQCDSVLVYPICGACEAKIQRLGMAPAPEEGGLYIL